MKIHRMSARLQKVWRIGNRMFSSEESSMSKSQAHDTKGVRVESLNKVIGAAGAVSNVSFPGFWAPPKTVMSKSSAFNDGEKYRSVELQIEHAK
jgi:hypothetical protein